MSKPGPEMAAAASILIFHKAAACASLLPRIGRGRTEDRREIVSVVRLLSSVLRLGASSSAG